jgi:hypothetical protein
VYNTSGGSGALEASDFTLTLSGGTATLASATPSSISSSSNTYTLGLSLSGTDNGSGTITVVPSSSTAIYDAAGNAASTSQSNNTVTLNGQTAPAFSSLSPSSSSTVNTTAVGYTLSKALASGTVTYTRISGTADSNSPHTVTLAGTELNSGTRSSAVLTNAPTLVSGSIYTIAFNGTDAGGNSATEVSVTGITYDTTAPTVTSVSTTAHYWQLIARQVDSDNFTDGTNELFSSNARSTFLQNENDNSSSTFMSIGNLTKSSYADTDGKYTFKLIWDGMQVDSLDNKSVTWTQTSWLDNTTITGFEEISNSGISTTDTNVVSSNNQFKGLGKSGSNQCVIDGNGGTSNWWNCVGVVSLHDSNGTIGMPGPLQKIASSMHLYIWAP